MLTSLRSPSTGMIMHRGALSQTIFSIVRLVSKENLPAFIFKRSTRDPAGDKDKYSRFQKYYKT